MHTNIVNWNTMMHTKVLKFNCICNKFYLHYSITKVIICNSSKQNCLLQLVHTTAITALTYFFTFFHTCVLLHYVNIVDICFPNMGEHMTIVTAQPQPQPQHQPQHKLKTTWKNKTRAIPRKQKLLVYIHKAQKSFRTPTPKKPDGAQKSSKWPPKSKNTKVRKQNILQNKSYQYIWINIKNIF